MLTEQLEFQISQYADGTLPASESRAIEQLLADDEQARATLEEYRSIDGALKRELAPPVMNWDRLAAQLSDRIAEADEAAAPAPIPLYVRLRPILSIAASVAIGFGIAALVYRNPPRSSGPVAGHAVIPARLASASVTVTGPTIEVSGAPRTQITIDASPLTRQLAAADAVVYRPPRIVIASSATARQNSLRFPY